MPQLVRSHFICKDLDGFRSHLVLCFWFQPDEKPDVSYSDIGGMDMQKQEMKEAVELPLTHFELYKQIGIDPPRGVLMYGPPGKNLSQRPHFWLIMLEEI